jgi:hypothetical protein
VSKTNDIDMAALDPTPEASGGGKSKALRVDGKSDGDAPVFRLDSLAPGADHDGVAPLPASTGARISHAAIFFAVLLVVGGGLLFAMRKVGINPMSAIANMKEPDVDLTKTGKTGVDHHRVLRDLSESTVKGQVPIEQVQKNPFEIPDVAGQSSDDPEAAAKLAADRARKDAEGRRQHIQNALASLQVHGILGGSTPVARINDEAVRIGDTIAEYFTVKSIHGRSVELECDGQVYTISIDDQAARQPTPKSGSRKK